MKLNNMLITMGVILAMSVTHCHAWWVRVSNKTSNVTFHPGDIYVHTTLVHAFGGNSIWNNNDLPPVTGYYEEYNGTIECFDYFQIQGKTDKHRFYIPNQCHNVNIEITDDGVYLNGSPARTYGDIVATLKDFGNVLAQPFEDVGTLIEKVTASTLIWVKNAGNFLINETQTLGYITKDVFTDDEADLNRNLKKAKDIGQTFATQTGKAFELFVKNVTATFSNMFTNPERADYCPFSATSTHSNMPKTIDDPVVRSQDKEGLIDVIKKYAPISYLDKNELYYPIWADEYFTSPTTRIKSKSTGKEYLKGKITFEKMYDLYTKCQNNDDLYFENDKCVIYGSNPMKNCAVVGQCGPERSPENRAALTTPLYVITNEYNGKIYIEYLYFYGLNGPYDIGPFKGDVTWKDIAGQVQNLHESDLEHISIELDKNTKQVTRVYFGSHGRTEGFWLDAKSPDITWEGTHPVVNIAHYGHGLYPKEGTYARIFGMANDVNVRGQRWEPTNLIRVYRENDDRFDPKTMGWLYWPGKMGAHGIDGASGKDWFTLGPVSADPHAGDVGRDPNADPRFCPNPSGDFLKGDVDYDNCLQKMVPLATIPD